MDKVPKETLIEWVQNIIDRRGTEDEIDQLIEKFTKAVPHPAPSDLIFWDSRELTPEEIVDLALAYQSLI
jgi:hypothetical protein